MKKKDKLTPADQTVLIKKYKMALEKIATRADGMHVAIIDYEACFKNMKAEAKEALKERCSKCGQ